MNKPANGSAVVTHDFLHNSLEKVRSIVKDDNEKRDKRIDENSQEIKSMNGGITTVLVKQEEIVGHVRTTDLGVKHLTKSVDGLVDKLKEDDKESKETHDNMHARITKNSNKVNWILGGIAVAGTAIGVIMFVINFFGK